MGDFLGVVFGFLGVRISERVCGRSGTFGELGASSFESELTFFGDFCFFWVFFWFLSAGEVKEMLTKWNKGLNCTICVRMEQNHERKYYFHINTVKRSSKRFCTVHFKLFSVRKRSFSNVSLC